MRTVTIILGAVTSVVGLALLITGNSWMYVFHGVLLLFLGTGVFMIVSYKDIILGTKQKNSKKKV